jgi:hypothetical protein
MRLLQSFLAYCDAIYHHSTPSTALHALGFLNIDY